MYRQTQRLRLYELRLGRWSVGCCLGLCPSPQREQADHRPVPQPHGRRPPGTSQADASRLEVQPKEGHFSEGTGHPWTADPGKRRGGSAAARLACSPLEVACAPGAAELKGRLGAEAQI